MLYFVYCNYVVIFAFNFVLCTLYFAISTFYMQHWTFRIILNHLSTCNYLHLTTYQNIAKRSFSCFRHSIKFFNFKSNRNPVKNRHRGLRFHWFPNARRKRVKLLERSLAFLFKKSCGSAARHQNREKEIKTF